jgi:hypothetical protein
LAWLIRRIKSRISAVVCGLPDGHRHFHVQYKAKAFRCQAMTVAGWTICRHRRQPDQNRDNRTHNTRSKRLRRKRRGAFRLENSQLVTKDENFGLQGGTGSKTRGDRGTKPRRTEVMMETTIILRMTANYAFSDPTEFSVHTPTFGPLR